MKVNPEAPRSRCCLSALIGNQKVAWCAVLEELRTRRTSLPSSASGLRPCQSLTRWQVKEISRLDVFISGQEDVSACEGNGKESSVL